MTEHLPELHTVVTGDAAAETVDVAPEAVLSTADKLDLLIHELSTMNPGDASPEARNFLTGLQMAQGMGFDLLAMIRPDDPDECALMVDGCIRLLLQIRGDDLPPFDPNNYGELAPIPEGF